MSNLKKDHGFGIIEVIVASGLLAVVSLGVVSFIYDSFRAQRGARATDVMRDFTVEVRSNLSDKDACLNTFSGSSLTSGSITQTTIKDKSNSDLFVSGTKYMGGLLSFNRIVMQDFIADAGYTNKGKVKLFIYADKTGNVIGSKTTHHILSAQIEMDATKNIIKCIAVGGLSDSLWQVSSVDSNNIYYQGGHIGIGLDNPTAVVTAQSDGAVLPTVPGFQSRHFGTGLEANGLSATTARGTVASPTAIRTGDRFLSIIGAPYNGSFYHNSAAIQFWATENHSSAGQGAAISFETIANGSPVTAGVTSRSERMRIDHNGNVGIGTTTPVSKLDINANLDNPVLSLRTFNSSNTAQSAINLHSKDDGNSLGSSANNLGWAIYSRGSTYTFGGDSPNKFGISYWDGTIWHTPYFNILPDGNTGINTIKPGVVDWGIGLSVKGTNNRQGKIEIIDSKADNNSEETGHIGFVKAGYSYNWPSDQKAELAAITANTDGTTAGNRGGLLAFYTRANGTSGAAPSRMVINQAGRVGIGTNTPLDQLHVANGMIRGQLNCRKVVGPSGAISTAMCAADEYVISGGGKCDANYGFLHLSEPTNALDGWTADCFRNDWSGEVPVIAYAVCCKK